MQKRKHRSFSPGLGLWKLWYKSYLQYISKHIHTWICFRKCWLSSTRATAIQHPENPHLILTTILIHTIYKKLLQKLLLQLQGHRSEADLNRETTTAKIIHIYKETTFKSVAVTLRSRHNNQAEAIKSTSFSKMIKLARNFDHQLKHIFGFQSSFFLIVSCKSSMFKLPNHSTIFAALLGKSVFTLGIQVATIIFYWNWSYTTMHMTHL